MAKIPEKIRGALEKLVNRIKESENVSAISLFGSWSRGDAVSSSDVDLLIIDEREILEEFVERVEVRGVLIDLNYIPKKWILGQIPPEIDQKIYEAYILYDRDWSFTNLKNWMMTVYNSPERLNIRTESYMVDADIYLSRASSALSRGDSKSAQLYAEKAAERMVTILMDLCQLPISKSRFLKTLEIATEKIQIPEIYAEYLALTKLYNIEREMAEKTLNSFKRVWDEIAYSIKKNQTNNVHFRVKSKLNYYLSPLVLQGTILRAKALIDSEENAETIRYLREILLDMLENYFWMKTKASKTQGDPTTLIRSLTEITDEKPNKIYKETIKIFNQENVNEKEARKSLEKAREIILKIRNIRRNIIQKIDNKFI
ncbi:hypothetical protein DRO54_02660 [Candidatus Bathyarchaeota archaeon]|nr:MAG: hypothetical protein DRO54_02660 [Candidatus Bathyarchaeota archaeon]